MDIGIIGGGASAMMFAAKYQSDNKVTILEKNSKLGKKLLLTGNGKCNFTNANFDNKEEIYNNDLASKLYNRYDNKSLIDFFKTIGIDSKIEVHKNETYYYPRSNKASSVYYCLLDKITSNGVNVVYNANVTTIKKDNNKFNVIESDKTYLFDKLIIATGGITYKSSGSDGSGYLLAKGLNHNIIKPVPALCGLKAKDLDIKTLKGVRADAIVSTNIDGKDYTESGEIQFTKNGISGIPIFNLSRLIDRYISDGAKVNISINFYDAKDINDLKNMLSERKNNISYKSSENFLCGLVPDELAIVIIKRSNVGKQFVKELTNQDIESIAKNIHNFSLQIDGYNDDNAQITLGGIDINDIDEKTLESRKCIGLYFIGEVIDIDGRCGGYNLQMAYSTASAVCDNI